MNPNFLNNISPEQISQFQKMMTPEMMKGMTNQLSAMSDDQLRSYLTSTGMGHVSPQMFRSMSQSMGNMSESDFNRMKTMDPSKLSQMPNHSMPSQMPQPEPKNIAERLDRIKLQGNELFKQKQYKEASCKYYEVINEILLASNEERTEYKDQLKELERVSRLNIANSKLQLNEYDTVINECLKVLDSDKCFRAYYRLGIALLKKGKAEKALEYLENARVIGTNDEKKAVESYIDECNKALGKDKQDKKEKPADNKQPEAMKEPVNEPIISKEGDTKHSKGSKLDKMEEMLQKEKEKNTNPIEEVDDEEIKIETIEKPKQSQITLPSHSGAPQYPYSQMQNSAYMPSQEQAKEKLNSMSDGEINSMVETMKSMDNETISSMLKSQGMSFSSQDIEFMKSSMTPEMLKMMKNNNMQMPSMPNMPPNQHSSISNEFQSSSASNPPQQKPTAPSFPSQMPDLGKMDFKSMMNFVKSNPAMLKMISPQLSQMMGGKEADPELMMNAMEKIFWVMSIPSRIKAFCLSKRGLCMIVLIIALIYAYFFKR